MEAQTSSHRHLRCLYIGTTSLSVFMILWILVLPSSALQGYSEWLDTFRSEHMLQGRTAHLPPKLLEKFEGHTAIHLTHTFPGVLWAGIIPFQLHPGFRKRNRRIHRVMGYIFIAVCALMMTGVYIIFQRGLFFENYLDELPSRTIRISEIGTAALSIWFTYTAIMATIEARRKRFAVHQEWILRHIASGMWIAVQRVMLAAITPLFLPPFFDGKVPQWVQGQLFSCSIQASLVVTIVASEYAIHLLRKKRREKKAH